MVRWRIWMQIVSLHFFSTNHKTQTDTLTPLRWTQIGVLASNAYTFEGTKDPSKRRTFISAEKDPVEIEIHSSEWHYDLADCFSSPKRDLCLFSRWPSQSKWIPRAEMWMLDWRTSTASSSSAAAAAAWPVPGRERNSDDARSMLQQSIICSGQFVSLPVRMILRNCW